MCEAPHWEGKNSALAWSAKESIQNLNKTNAQEQACEERGNPQCHVSLGCWQSTGQKAVQRIV